MGSLPIRMEYLSEKGNKEDMMRMLTLADDSLGEHAKLWELSMKVMKVSSKEYKKICKSGKLAQEALYSIYFTLEKTGLFSKSELDEAAPHMQIGYVFN